MGEDYTPSVDEVRDRFAYDPDGWTDRRDLDRAEFDRWLAQVESAAERRGAVQALRDAADESERLGTNAHAWLRDRADAGESNG